MYIGALMLAQLLLTLNSAAITLLCKKDKDLLHTLQQLSAQFTTKRGLQNPG